MPNIIIKENEPFDIALRRFKRCCEKCGILTEVKKREFYEKPTTKRKKAKTSAIKRNIKNKFFKNKSKKNI